MLVELYPQSREAVVTNKIREVISERRRLESRIAELKDDAELTEANLAYRETKAQNIADANARLADHQEQCRADAKTLVELDRHRKGLSAAVELHRLQAEVGKLNHGAGILAREIDIDIAKIEGEKND